MTYSQPESGSCLLAVKRKSAMCSDAVRTPVPYGFKQCSLCDKLVKNQGLGGHMWGVHSVKVGPKARMADMQQRLEKVEDVEQKVNWLWDFAHCICRSPSNGSLAFPDGEGAKRFYSQAKGTK